MPGFHIWNAWERVLEVATLIVPGHGAAFAADESTPRLCSGASDQVL